MKDAVPGREDGNDRGEVRENATKCKQKSEKQCSFPRHVEIIGNGAYLDPSTAIQGTLGKGKRKTGTVR